MQDGLSEAKPINFSARGVIDGFRAQKHALNPSYELRTRCEVATPSAAGIILIWQRHREGATKSGRRLRGLQIACGLLAPLGHDIEADLLPFHEGAHAGALDRADVHEHVLAAVARLDESKAFLSIEELHGTCGHHGLLTLQLVYVSDHASIAWPVIQFWGSWLGTVKRKRREADRKLVAGCYLCDRGRNVNPDAGINRRRLLHWVIGALVEALNGIAIKGLPSRSLRPCAHWARGCRSLTRPTPKAIADPATFSAQQWRCIAERVTLQGCPVVCFSSGGASAASRSALRSAAFSSFFLCFSSVRARA